jgi:hypothetical protein
MPEELNLTCSCGEEVKLVQPVTITYYGSYYITGFEALVDSKTTHVEYVRGTCGQKNCKPVIIARSDILNRLPKHITILPGKDRNFVRPNLLK